jgi:hypothetical protein
MLCLLNQFEQPITDSVLESWRSRCCQPASRHCPPASARSLDATERGDGAPGPSCTADAGSPRSTLVYTPSRARLRSDEASQTKCLVEAMDSQIARLESHANGVSRRSERSNLTSPRFSHAPIWRFPAPWWPRALLRGNAGQSPERLAGGAPLTL